MIELQGNLHNANGSGLHGMDLGELEWVNVGWGRLCDWKGNPVLSIGNHLCEGKVVKLRKPLASGSSLDCLPVVMRKTANSIGEGNGECWVHHLQKEVQYEIDVIIHEKFLFSNRPRPLLRWWEWDERERRSTSYYLSVSIAFIFLSLFFWFSLVVRVFTAESE